MKLGVLITKAEYREYIIPVIRAALKRGDEVTVFMMDDGCLLANDREFASLAGDVKVNICDLNRGQRGIEPPAEIHSGSQYDNIRMVRGTERLLVF